MSRNDKLMGATSVYISLYLRQQAKLKGMNLSRFLESCLESYFKNESRPSAESKTIMELNEDIKKLQGQRDFISVKEAELRNQLILAEVEQKKKRDSEHLILIRKVQAIRDSGVIGEMHK
jgi:hypothetical protein